MTKAPPIILASTSPRRRALLGGLRVPFEIRAADIDERPLPAELPIETAKRVALAKAEAIASKGIKGIILGADTIVVLAGTILGKPRDRDEAFRMLRALRGREHDVITGVALLNTDNGQKHISAVITKVWMRNYSDEEMAAYIASGDTYDKAGAYAIQNNMLRPVERIEGCYFNVVGLPLCEVIKGLIEVGYPSSALPINKLDEICPHDIIGLDLDQYPS